MEDWLDIDFKMQKLLKGKNLMEIDQIIGDIERRNNDEIPEFN